MENNGWKFALFGVFLLGIIIGGFFLMKRSFPENNTVKEVSNKKP